MIWAYLLVGVVAVTQVALLVVLWRFARPAPADRVTREQVEAEMSDELDDQLWLLSGEFPVRELPYGVDGNA